MKNNNKAKMITLLLGAGLLFGACGTTQAATNEVSLQFSHYIHRNCIVIQRRFLFK